MHVASPSSSDTRTGRLQPIEAGVLTASAPASRAPGVDMQAQDILRHRENVTTGRGELPHPRCSG
ncbi:hypothetical protein KPATCC21470_8583 [Kitasatospora purpeofusca]